MTSEEERSQQQQDHPQTATAAATTEIEVNFRLDSEGRTQPTRPPTATGAAASSTTGNAASDGAAAAPLDYESKTARVRFEYCCADAGGDDNGAGDDARTAGRASEREITGIVDELLLDCEISDCGLMPRTYWVPATGFEPRFSLEQMALDAFNYHVKRKRSSSVDLESSGAEWWVQIRPSPEKAGRYSMLAGDNGNSDSNNDLAKDGISFHWDKDEDLRLLCGGNTYVHPHLSTVTYLTSIGAPTLAISYRINNLTGEWITDPVASAATISEREQSPTAAEAFVSWPLEGKHLSFDGRFLHAAPPDLMKRRKFKEQCNEWKKKREKPSGGTTENKEGADGEEAAIIAKEEKRRIRRHRRVTFLVNVWLNYHPFEVKPFPETMIDKMSGNGKSGSGRRVKLNFDAAPGGSSPSNGKSASPQVPKDVSVKDGKVEVSDDDQKEGNQHPPAAVPSTQKFVWPMGDCGSNEFIEAAIPLGEVRSEADRGGNVKIRWKSAQDVQLVRRNHRSNENEIAGTGAGAKTTTENSNKRQKVDPG